MYLYKTKNCFRVNFTATATVCEPFTIVARIGTKYNDYQTLDWTISILLHLTSGLYKWKILHSYAAIMYEPWGEMHETLLDGPIRYTMCIKCPYYINLNCVIFITLGHKNPNCCGTYNWLGIHIYTQTPPRTTQLWRTISHQRINKKWKFKRDNS